MRAQELIGHFTMEAHPEHGQFAERHYADSSGNRPASGCIYYYVAPGERTEFHRIDCDEYWCYHAGSPLELWIIGKDGQLRRTYCGITDGAEPCVRFAAGEIFASRSGHDAQDGTFLSCITVPRFCYEGFEMIGKEEMVRDYPATAAFWSDDGR